MVELYLNSYARYSKQQIENIYPIQSMPTLTLKQTHIKNINNKGVLNIEIPLSFLMKILSIEKKTEANIAPKNNIWEQAYGLWKEKHLDPLQYQRKLRNEWL